MRYDSIFLFIRKTIRHTISLKHQMVRLLPNLKFLKALQHKTATPTQYCRATHGSRDTNHGPRHLRRCGHLLGLLARFFDCADHVECLLGEIVVLAFDDFLEGAHIVGDFHVLAFEARELLRDEHGL